MKRAWLKSARVVRCAFALRREASFVNAQLADTDLSVSPQLFILGLPRSGTTLVSQYLAHRAKFAYFTNHVGNRPYDPCRTTAEDLRTNPSYRSDFRSRYGRVEGPMAPREAGNFWLRFFDIDAYQTFADLGDSSVEVMRRTVRCVQRLFGGAPFFNKNVKHVLRIDALRRVFPDSCFLVIDRDPRDVALSILRARWELYGDYKTWFSVRPDCYESIRHHEPAAQVCSQLFEIERRMRQDLETVGSNRVLRLSYADFCARPDTIVDLVASALGEVESTNDPIDSFDQRRSAPENDVEWRLVELVAARIESDERS